jgi:ferredoxin-NADP reductase
MQYISQLLARKVIASNTLELTFERPDGFLFQPGNYSLFTIPSDVEVHDTQGSSRYFSLVNSPEAETLSIITRIRGTGFKRYLTDTPLGSNFLIEDARSKFAFTTNSTSPMVCIAAGVGLAPFASLVRTMTARNIPQESLFVFSSNKSRFSAIYHDEFTNLSQTYPWLHFIPTMTHPDENTKWHGEVGRIDASMLARYFPDMGATRYYIAGSRSFNLSMCAMLRATRVPEDQIAMEDFCGYDGFCCPHCVERYTSDS